MEPRPKRIKSFTDLDTWKEGHKLALQVYRLTKDFPKGEQFGSTAQLRRAVVSFTSNIAEGFSRTSWREKVQFYSTALGSLTEVQNQLLLARDIGYVPKADFDPIAKQTIVVNKLASGLIKKSKSMIQDS